MAMQKRRTEKARPMSTPVREAIGGAKVRPNFVGGLATEKNVSTINDNPVGNI